MSSRVAAAPTTLGMGAPGLPEIRLQIAGLSNPATMAINGETGARETAIIDGSEIVLGVPIDDGQMLKIARRVIILAAIGASFYICNFNINLLRGNYNAQDGENGTSLWAAVSSLLIELSIPACGYCGAVYNNRQLTCCFCSCNLFIAIVSIMSFVRLNIRTGEIDGQCEREQNAQQRKTCEVWTSQGIEKYIMLGSTLLIVCLGCLAFWFGNNLYNRLAHDSALLMPPPAPLVGEVISLDSSGAEGETQGLVLTSDPQVQTPEGGHHQIDSQSAADSIPPDRPDSVNAGEAAPVVDGNGLRSNEEPTSLLPLSASESSRMGRALPNAQPRPAPGDDAPAGTDSA